MRLLAFRGRWTLLVLLFFPLAAAPAAGQTAFRQLGDVHCSLGATPSGSLVSSQPLAVPYGVSARLTFTPHETLAANVSVSWHGIHGTVVRIDHGAALVAIPSPGVYTVEARIEAGAGMTGRTIASRRITFEARNVAAHDVEATIVYPGRGGQMPVDIDGDGFVDRADLTAFRQTLGSEAGAPSFRAIADWDGSGVIDDTDNRAFRAAFRRWQGIDLGQVYDDGTVLPVSTRQPGLLFSPPVPIGRAVTDPSGFERWIEWSLDGQERTAGAVWTEPIPSSGSHRLGVGLFGRSMDKADLTTYRIAAFDPTRERLFDPERDTVREGVDYAFEAVTEPPGFASHVTWRASTEYGTVSNPAHQGATFAVSFANTFGSEDRRQRVIVQADGLVIDQHVRASGQFPAALAHALHGVQGKLSTVIRNQTGKPAGGRAVLRHIRNEFLPVYYAVLDFEMQASGIDALVAFRTISEVEVLAEIDRQLGELSDEQLNQLIFVDSELRLYPADFAVDAGLAARIDAETDAAGFLVSSSWVLKWLWNKSQAVLGCLAQGPAKLIVKLIGAIHKGIHDAFAAPTPIAPTQPVIGSRLAIGIQPVSPRKMAHATLTELANMARAVTDHAGAADGGRQVILHVRDKMLPFVASVLRGELPNVGQAHMTPFLDRGVADTITALDALLDRSDLELNERVFGEITLLPTTQAILVSEARIRTMIDATVPLATDTGKLTILGDFDIVKWLWDTAVGFIGCIPNIGALLEKLVGTVHDVAHTPATDLVGPELTALTALTDLVNQINALGGHPQRGRTLALHLRDRTLPALQEVLNAKFVDMGEPHLKESVAIGVGGQQARMTALLDRSDDSLNAGLYDSKGAVLAYAETFTEVFGTEPVAEPNRAGASAGNVWNALIRFIKCLSEGSQSTAAAAGVDLGTQPFSPIASAPTRGEGGGSDKLVWVIEQLHSFLH